MQTNQKDKDILRHLAERVAKIADLPIQQENIKNWKRVNSLKKTKPMIWINEIPWHEMNVKDELNLKTSNEFYQTLERKLRRIIYRWNHLPGDMVVENNIDCYPIIYDSNFGIKEEVDIVKTDPSSSVVSRDFKPQINDESDLEKIKLPEVIFDQKATEEKYQLMVDIFDGLLNVRRKGVPGFWFAPWDELIRWWDVEKAMMDLVLKPDLVHKAMERLVSAYLHRLDQYENQNLLGYNNGNYRIGSGGLGYTYELPQNDDEQTKVTASDLWGSGAAQIFSDVSPKMHEEFALQYEIRWLKRFGLNYYGCCEPLHKKVDILSKIPNLRKISMSPWVNVDEAAHNIGRKYVYSMKPNPAVLATNTWDLEIARKKLKSNLEKTKDCVVEIIMKDISTIQYQPQRLWEWAQMAKEVSMEYA